MDDHAPFREGLRALLTSVPEMTVAGEAENGEEAIRNAAKFQPDVILMDIQIAWHERHRGHAAYLSVQPAHRRHRADHVRR